MKKIKASFKTLIRFLILLVGGMSPLYATEQAEKAKPNPSNMYLMIAPASIIDSLPINNDKQIVKSKQFYEKRGSGDLLVLIKQNNQPYSLLFVNDNTDIQEVFKKFGINKKVLLNIYIFFEPDDSNEHITLRKWIHRLGSLKSEKSQTWAFFYEYYSPLDIETDIKIKEGAPLKGNFVFFAEPIETEFENLLNHINELPKSLSSDKGYSRDSYERLKYTFDEMGLSPLLEGEPFFGVATQGDITKLNYSINKSKQYLEEDRGLLFYRASFFPPDIKEILENVWFSVVFNTEDELNKDCDAAVKTLTAYWAYDCLHCVLQRQKLWKEGCLLIVIWL
ncbi:MAG: hypothetical protein ACPGC9_01980, partial [Cytophagales bacterium]